jgi:RimJ/RimL family protein N-acetyltransferase
MTLLETPRLILRTWQDSDLAPFITMNQDSKVMEFFPKLLSAEESKNLVNKIHQHFDTHGFGLFAVELKATKEFIGFVGLATPSFAAHFTPCVEIGWRIAKAHWNQGYATEAARAVLHTAFEKYGLEEVVSFTSTHNKSSRRVMEKLGMTHNPQDDFEHPNIPEHHPLRKHVLYRYHKKQLKVQDMVTIEAHNPAWQEQAQKEINALKECCNFSWLVDIVHIGSTAISGLAAKPILDIAIGVTDLDQAKALIPILLQQHYIFWEDNPDTSKLFFVKGMPPFGTQRSHHIHVMLISHHDWVIRPLFRDYLNAHPEIKTAYEHLKQQLATQFQNDREAYTEAKTQFIRTINLKAAAEHLEFQPLTSQHFPLLLKWLETAHIKTWWDQAITWTPDLIAKKYAHRPDIHAYIIAINKVPIGYIQFYNAHDFAKAPGLDHATLPQSLAALDFYIGEPTFLKKGFGTLILKEFLARYVAPKFENSLVETAINNSAAIKACLNNGFSKLYEQAPSLWLVKRHFDTL